MKQWLHDFLSHPWVDKLWSSQLRNMVALEVRNVDAPARGL